MAKESILGSWAEWRYRIRGDSDSTASGATAQELYAAAIKEVVSPALRELGFKGSGGRYELPSSTHWALLAFQKSAYSDRAELRFTVNLCAIPRAEWDAQSTARPHLGKKPSAGTMYGNWAPQKRIGSLTPSRDDVWWRIGDSAPVEDVVLDVLSHIEQYGLPWLKAATSGQPI